MSTATKKDFLHVALVGNPNTGKSTLFNALCGMRQRVGNYPGVTVEKKVGRCKIAATSFNVIDLPGSYSLAPRSPDEMVAVEVLLGLRSDVDQPDVVVCIVDASNLERNLYLVSQVLELNLPTVIALNMVDVAEANGIAVDSTKLGQRMGVEVVDIQANRRINLQTLCQAIERAATVPPRQIPSPFPDAFQTEVTKLEKLSADSSGARFPRYLAERLLLDVNGFLATAKIEGVTERVLADVKEAQQRLTSQGIPVPAVEAISRYQWVGQVTEGAIRRVDRVTQTFSDRLDHILTHRFWGTVTFLFVMLLMFESVFVVGEYASAGIDWLNGLATDAVNRQMLEGPLRSLVVDGVIAGVGGVITFLPQIFVLFFFIAILEDCGYMARAAYLMDKLMSRVGLSGKSFIPLLSSFACAIPGIMSARVIENRRDRLLTILIAPLMSCSARFPVYILLVQAFIPDQHWLRGLPGLRSVVIFAMYLLGVVAAVAVAWVLRGTIFRGPTPPFVMELPTFKLPGTGLVLHRMWESGWSFVQRAGTLILAVSILVWAAAYYPRDVDSIEPLLLERQSQLSAQLENYEVKQNAALTNDLQNELTSVENRIQGEYLRHSYLGKLGRFIEPVVRPLGWDWRIGCAVVASFPAREVVIATLGVIYNLGQGADEKSDDLRDTLRSATWDGTDRLVFNIPVALSIMVFFSLCAQCVSTLVVMRRETNSWKWPAFTFAYMTVLAYVAAFVTFQVGNALS